MKRLYAFLALLALSGVALATTPSVPPFKTSKVNVDTIANQADSGAPNFTHGLTLSTSQLLQADSIANAAGTGAPTFTQGLILTALKTLQADLITNAAGTGQPKFTQGLDLTEISTPSSPAASVLRLYSKSGDGLYYKNSSGTETQVGTTSTATPTVAGITTSYFPTIQSSINNVSNAGYTITTTDGYQAIFVTTGNTNRTVTLPGASSNGGRKIFIKKVDSGTGTVSIARAGSDTIDGATSYTLTSQNDSATVVSDGSATFNIIGGPLATSTQSGDVSTGTQTFAGAKTFSTSVTVGTGSAQTNVNSGNLTNPTISSGTATLANNGVHWMILGHTMLITGYINYSAMSGAVLTIPIPGGYSLDTTVPSLYTIQDSATITFVVSGSAGMRVTMNVSGNIEIRGNGGGTFSGANSFWFNMAVPIN